MGETPTHRCKRKQHIHNRWGGISSIRHVCRFSGAENSSQPIWRRLLSAQSSSISTTTSTFKCCSSTQWGTHATPSTIDHTILYQFLAISGDIYRWLCTQMIYLFICLLPNAKMTQLPRYRTRISPPSSPPTWIYFPIERNAEFAKKKKQKQSNEKGQIKKQCKSWCQSNSSFPAKQLDWTANRTHVWWIFRFFFCFYWNYMYTNRRHMQAYHFRFGWAGNALLKYKYLRKYILNQSSKIFVNESYLQSLVIEGI